LQSAFGDLSEQAFARLVESHAVKRQSAEATEGLASFAEKRAANWTPK
jgi:methylglutaconyl-CoA hydratase